MMGPMKLSDALVFSRERLATHAADLKIVELAITANDFGIEIVRVNSKGYHDSVTEAWSEMDPEMRQLLMKSEHWEPVDPKPVMLIIAEAACDWTIHERDEESEHHPLEEEGYNV